jgi:hypothetical protein
VLLFGHVHHLQSCKGPPEPPTEEEIAAQVNSSTTSTLAYKFLHCLLCKIQAVLHGAT